MPACVPKKPLLYLSLFLVVAVPAFAKDLIPAGTILQCTLDEPSFSGKTALPGDPVLCHLGPLGEFGHSVFPRGAMLGGHLEDSKKPGHFVGKGWIELAFDHLILPNAEVVPLASKVISAPHMHVDAQGDVHGKGHAKRDVVEWMIPVMWPEKVATLANRGPYPTFKGESHIALRVMEDVEIPGGLRSAVPMPPWASPSAYNNAPYSGYAENARATSPYAANRPVVTTASYAERATTSVAPSTIIALKDGSALIAQQYWIAGGKMNCVNSAGERRTIALDQIDLYESARVNRERNVEFTLQSRELVPSTE